MAHEVPERFDFKERHETGVLTCRRVAEGAPVLFVSHDEDGEWQILCGGDHPDAGPDGAVVACLGCNVAKDPSLNVTAGLGRGQQLTRDSASAPWANTQEDARWQRILGQSWSCRTCHEEHHDLFDLAYGKPEQWSEGEDKKPNSEVRRSKHFLAEDFCVLNGESYFVRSVLELPLQGTAGRTFGVGVWSTLSEANFNRHRETFDSGEMADLGPWFGWFSNRLKGYPDTLNLKCQVHPRPGRQRPWIDIMQEEHPLAVEQRNGISIERLAEILALNDHNVDAEVLKSPPERPEQAVHPGQQPWWKRIWKP